MTRSKKSPPPPRGAGGQDLRALGEEMVAYLASVVRSKPKGRQLAVGVSAASRVLAHVEWHVDRSDPKGEGTDLDRKTLDELVSLAAESQRRIDEAANVPKGEA